MHIRRFDLEHYIREVTVSGSPLHRKNRKNHPIHQGKHREFGNFAKTQGILLAQVVNSLILKIQDITMFVANFLNLFSKSVLLMKLSQISRAIFAANFCNFSFVVSFAYEIVANFLNCQGKISSWIVKNRENTGNL